MKKARPPSGQRVAVDVRALQDDNYATKGIGQHCGYIVQALRSVRGIELLPFGDPHQRPLRPEHRTLFDAPLRGLRDLTGDVFLNPSPLTGDTYLLVLALRRGMRCGAIVHDFIPLRSQSPEPAGETALAYRYLLRSLGRYHFLLANSWFTETEIHTWLPDFAGRIATVHCRSRFAAPPVAVGVPAAKFPRLAELDAAGRYAFLASADDPRKNIDIAVRAARELHAMGLRLVIGGGLSEATRRRLITDYPDAFALAPPLVLPRLTDEELRAVYARATLVLVCSLDEGFSLPVAEAISLDRVTIASNIPAHSEQILDSRLLFDPHEVESLISAAKHAVAPPDDAKKRKPRYRRFDFKAEANALHELVLGPGARGKPVKRALIVVGPSFDRPTGIAVYNRLLVEELERRGREFTYVDVDAMNATAFYDWLFDSHVADLIYVMGNNDRYHNRCFAALVNVPGRCIMHDSRLFEFTLNREGPHKIVDTWNLRHPESPIDIYTVEDWQRERRMLKHSFLEPLVAHALGLHVHSKVMAQHVVDTYGYREVGYLSFAQQMTDEEMRHVVKSRREKTRGPGEPVRIVMLGETEPTKACCEIIFALKMLAVMGVEAALHFVGKCEEPYRSELLDHCRKFALMECVHFANYVSRQTYLEELARADVVIQLRYPLFGQVSGPLGDAVACGAPVVTTAELAYGMGLESCCAVIPDEFSPLHIAMAVRRLMETPPSSSRRLKAATMEQYAKALLDEPQFSAA